MRKETTFCDVCERIINDEEKLYSGQFFIAPTLSDADVRAHTQVNFATRNNWCHICQNCTDAIIESFCTTRAARKAKP